MAHNFKDIFGQRFGHLVAFEPSSARESTNQVILWLCQCDCGRWLLVNGNNLRYGHSTQCSICSNNSYKSHFILKETIIDD